MKDKIAEILQSRMDKCTNEQFWATGAITGLYAFLLTQSSTISKDIPNWAVLGTCVGVAAYGIYFVIHRHISFYELLASLAKLLNDEPTAPSSLKTCPNKWKGHALSGMAFYVGCIVIGCISVLVTYVGSA